MENYESYVFKKCFKMYFFIKKSIKVILFEIITSLNHFLHELLFDFEKIPLRVRVFFSDKKKRLI